MKPSGVDQRGRRPAGAAALAAIVLAAAGLRLAGIGYLLPSVMNRDGMVLLRQVEVLRGGPRSIDADAWRYGFYPHLMARLGTLWPEDPRPTGPVPLARHLELASAPWIRLRELSVALSLLAIPATYRLARRFAGRGSSLLAAALVATSLHHVVLSIQEKPHAAATGFVALTLLAALRLRRKPDVRAYLLCGAAGGLAIGTLQSTWACLFAVGAAFLVRDRTKARASPAWFLATAALLLLALRVFYPFYFESEPGQDGALGFGRKLLGLAGGAPVGRILSAAWALDPVLVTAAAAGILGWIVLAARDPTRRRSALRGDLAVILAFAVPYALVLVAYRETLVRFCLPFVPLSACAAAWALERVRPRAARLAVGLAAVAASLVPALHFARIRTRPSPLDEAARWVEAHVDPGEAVVVVPSYDLPLLATDDAIAANREPPYRTIWAEYQAHAAPGSLEGPRRRILVEPGRRPGSREKLAEDPVGYLREAGARYAVIDLSGIPSGVFRDRMELLERISPAERDDGRSRGVVLWGTGYDPLRPSALGILGLRSLGTSVEIYRIP